MKKMLYIMHVDWDWIKQRPHYLAEHLSMHYNLFIVYPYDIIRTNLTKNRMTGFQLKPIPRIPFQGKAKFLFSLNQLLIRLYIGYIINRIKPDYIWISFPYLFEWLPANHNCELIYDCMDDACAFGVKKDSSHIVNLEINIIKQASIVFVSSENLMKVLNKREPCNGKMVLIRNAFDGNILQVAPSKNMNIKIIYKICYIGTVSTWFDFQSLNFCLQQINNIEFHIIGPVESGINKRTHERIVFHGPINHSELYSHIKNFDCLIMPFLLNDLVLSVDPVKLYEYVNFNKPIISIYYDEIKRFSPFISFYSTKEELLDIITNMIKVGFINKYTENERIKLLEENSWNCRMNRIMQFV